MPDEGSRPLNLSQLRVGSKNNLKLRGESTGGLSLGSNA